MKKIDDVYEWLEAIKTHRKNAPEGVSVVPAYDGKYSRFKLENVSPEAIKIFKNVNGLSDCNEIGRYVSFYESESITVLDFDYPFLPKPSAPSSVIEWLKASPKLVRQDKYRLIFRDKK